MATFKETINYDPTLEMICEAMASWKVAEKLGLSHTRVDQIVKKCLGKIFKVIRNESNESPFAVVLIMQKMLNIGETQEEVKSFLNLFPKDIRALIEEDAKKKLAPMQRRKEKTLSGVNLETRKIL